MLSVIWPSPTASGRLRQATCLTSDNSSKRAASLAPGTARSQPCLLAVPHTKGPWQDNSTASPLPCQEQGLCSAAEVLQAQGEQASPGHSKKHCTISSVEQCRAYEAAFSADYTEYHNLHTRIGNVSWKFIQLGAKMKVLKQGTEECKARGAPGA